MHLTKKTLIALLPYFLQVQAGASGTGTTTRYWDCCKPSCAWSGKTTLMSGSNPVETCDINDNPLTDANAASGCGGGTAYMCSNEAPWAVTEDLAYGYAAVNIAGGSEESWCCACYELTFTSGSVAGKKMIVQATNTGGDLGSNQFDISIPGGGVGIFNGCTTEWGAPSSGWGAQYGGISSRSDCDSFPEALKAGCYWRFDWLKGSDNPTVSFKQVACPAAITKNTGCTRADNTNQLGAVAPSGSTVAAAVGSNTAEAIIASSSVGAVVDPVSTSETSEPTATNTDPGEAAKTSENLVTSAKTAVDPTPTSISSARTATTSAADDDVCGL